MNDAALDRFAFAYAQHREAEGRGYSGDDLLRLPYLTKGPHARQWTVRARSFDAFMKHVVRPQRAELGRPLCLLDLGAGNGWLSYRVALEENETIALDVRSDDVDGLGAAAALVERVPERMRCIAGSFDSIPLDDGQVDIAVFNASLHYSSDIQCTLAEAARVVRPGGAISIVDSPFYRSEQYGRAMVAQKQRDGRKIFGEHASILLGTRSIEFLTEKRLSQASASSSLRWTRKRVSYPVWYELRPFTAALLGKRPPSRFDLWIAERP
jgi:ubiquinone/menaquinone biosynthesis C-methylase UbiE